MRKIITAAMIALTLVVFAPAALHASEVTITVNGNLIEFDVPPFIADGRTMVPLRPIAEALRFYPEWRPETQEIVLWGEVTLFLTIGSAVAHIVRSAGFAGSELNIIEIDTPPVIVNGRTFVPARFIAESLGADVKWDDQTRAVIITSESTVVRVDLSFQDITNERLAEMVTSGRIPTDVTKLDLRANSISDISPLSDLADLVELNLWGNQVSDISPLSGLTNLTALNLWGNQFSDISPLSELTNLTNFSMGDNLQFNGDISVLSNLSNLIYLGLGSHQTKDFTPLENLVKLEYLHLWGVQQLNDLTALGNLTNLTSLTIHGASVEDFSALGNLTNLISLDLQSNQVRIDDISSLYLDNLTNLTDLTLLNNHISDISALSGLTSLTHLRLDGNQIRNIAPFANLINLEELWLLGNPITDWSPVEHVEYVSGRP